MLLKAGDLVFHAHFVHTPVKKGKRVRWSTQCTLHPGACQPNEDKSLCVTPGRTGSTRCHTKLDVFHKENGRRTALGRAMLDPGATGHPFVPRPIRKALWEHYWKLTNDKKPRRNGTR